MRTQQSSGSELCSWEVVGKQCQKCTSPLLRFQRSRALRCNPPGRRCAAAASRRPTWGLACRCHTACMRTGCVHKARGRSMLEPGGGLRGVVRASLKQQAGARAVSAVVCCIHSESPPRMGKGFPHLVQLLSAMCSLCAVSQCMQHKTLWMCSLLSCW